MYIVIRNLCGRYIVPKESTIHPWAIIVFEGTMDECKHYCR